MKKNVGFSFTVLSGLFLLFLAPPVAFSAGDLELKSLKIEYFDKVTNSKSPVYRELTRFDDNDYWSKPKKVNLIVTVKNIGDKRIKFKLSPQLYFLMEAYKGLPYSMSDKHKDLKSIAEFPVWVWNSTHFVFGAPVKLQPKEEKIITIENFNLEQLTQVSKEYQKSAFAIRVFTSIYPRRSDKNLENNIIEKVFYLTK